MVGGCAGRRAFVISVYGTHLFISLTAKTALTRYCYKVNGYILYIK